MSEKKVKAYGGFIFAVKENTSSVCAISVHATSREEALGKALVFCGEKYPRDEGFNSHTVDVVKVEEINQETA